jgi:hypothetical protein
VYLRPSTRVEQVQRASFAIIRCEGVNPNDGRRCGALLEVPIHDKTVCEQCGWVSPPWSGYSSFQRTVTKSQQADHLSPVVAEPDPSPAPHPSSP